MFVSATGTGFRGRSGVGAATHRTGVGVMYATAKGHMQKQRDRRDLWDRKLHKRLQARQAQPLNNWLFSRSGQCRKLRMSNRRIEIHGLVQLIYAEGLVRRRPGSKGFGSTCDLTEYVLTNGSIRPLTGTPIAVFADQASQVLPVVI